MVSFFSRDSSDGFSMGLPESTLVSQFSNEAGLMPAISIPRNADPFLQNEDLLMSRPSITESPDVMMKQSSSLYFPVDMFPTNPEEESMDTLSSEVVDVVPSGVVDPSRAGIVDPIPSFDLNPVEATNTTQPSVDLPDKRESTVSVESPQSTTDSVESDDDWNYPNDSEGALEGFRIQSRSSPRHWTAEECDRLREAVKLWGSSKRWNKISAYVSTRSVSQCINKWKNDLSKEGKRQRWSPDATARLRQFLDEGLLMKEIQTRMPEYTYIQIYQQTNKLRTNTAPWEPWEYELLVKLKTAGEFSDTDIGRRLNNRHRDVVKNMWSHLKRERIL